MTTSLISSSQPLPTFELHESNQELAISSSQPVGIVGHPNTTPNVSPHLAFNKDDIFFTDNFLPENSAKSLLDDLMEEIAFDLTTPKVNRQNHEPWISKWYGPTDFEQSGISHAACPLPDNHRLRHTIDLVNKKLDKEFHTSDSGVNSILIDVYLNDSGSRDIDYLNELANTNRSFILMFYSSVIDSPSVHEAPSAMLLLGKINDVTLVPVHDETDEAIRNANIVTTSGSLLLFRPGLNCQFKHKASINEKARDLSICLTFQKVVNRTTDVPVCDEIPKDIYTRRIETNQVNISPGPDDNIALTSTPFIEKITSTDLREIVNTTFNDKRITSELKAMHLELDGNAFNRKQRLIDHLLEWNISPDPPATNISLSILKHITNSLTDGAIISELNRKNAYVPRKKSKRKKRLLRIISEGIDGIEDVLSDESIISLPSSQPTISLNSVESEQQSIHKNVISSSQPPPNTKALSPTSQRHPEDQISLDTDRTASSDLMCTPSLTLADTCTQTECRGSQHDQTAQSTGNVMHISKDFALGAANKLSANLVNYELTRNGLSVEGDLSTRRKALKDHISSLYDNLTTPDSEFTNYKPEHSAPDPTSIAPIVTAIQILERSIVEITKEIASQKHSFELLLSQQSSSAKNKTKNTSHDHDFGKTITDLYNLTKDHSTELNAIKALLSSDDRRPVSLPNYTTGSTTTSPMNTSMDDVIPTELEEIPTHSQSVTLPCLYSPISETPLQSNQLNESLPPRGKENAKPTTPSQRPSQSHKPPSSYPSNQFQHRRRHTLLIHDSHHSQFEENKFPRQLEIVKHKAGSMKMLENNGKLENIIKRNRPECVFVHLGFNDLTNHQDPNTLLDRYEKLIWYLLEESDVSILMSTIIPTKGNRILNAKIDMVNDHLIRLIDDIRYAKPFARTRLFSYKNASLGLPNLYNNDGVHLNEHGTKKLMINLKEGIKKALRIPRSGSNLPQRNEVDYD